MLSRMSLQRAVLTPAKRELSALRRLPYSLREQRERTQAFRAGRRWGTVILPFGRYFASRADLLARDGFKTIVPIDGISPFTATGDPDPDLQYLAAGDRVTDRAELDLAKDLAERMRSADAHFLLIDNSSALLTHREIDGRLYTMVPGEDSELMDLLQRDDPDREPAFKVSHRGLTDELRARYDDFVAACLAVFEPDRIIMVRSHVPRFFVGPDGVVRPTDLDRREAHLVEELDDYFIERTGCQVADGSMRYFPSTSHWQTFSHDLRRIIEDDVLAICDPPHGHRIQHPAPSKERGPARTSAADRVVGAAREGRAVDYEWLKRHFAAGDASYDDLLALACLSADEDADQEAVRLCVRLAVADAESRPCRDTRQRFLRSVAALRRWPWCSVPGWRQASMPRPSHDLWRPQIAVLCGGAVLRFLDDGTIDRVPVTSVGVDDAEAIVDGRTAITPNNVVSVLASWPVYLERGRRGAAGALPVAVSDLDELLGTCGWLDWSEVLRHERLVISPSGRPGLAARLSRTRTDLAFMFDPTSRIGTVGGGLMDQVTHIALFDQLCRPLGLRLYIDDFRYTWWRSHNGFEASRLAPKLERRRLTHLVSQPLVESFRAEVATVRLPWLYSQAHAWYRFGLTDASVVTWDHTNSRRLMESEPVFPVHVYAERTDLAELIRTPPRPLSFFTTQQRIPVSDRSAADLRRIFSYRHLEREGLDPSVAATAALIKSTPHVALHIRRGDYLNPHFDLEGWHVQQSHYVAAIDYLITSELGTDDFDLAVFSDDLDFVRDHVGDYGIDKIRGTVRFVSGNNHYMSIFDSYLMSLCPIIVGSVGFFAATTSLLAEPPSVFIRATVDAVSVNWRR